MSDRVLFVSGRCEHSKKILIGIQQHAFLKPLFKVVNIDTQPYPNYVKSVPSILINSQVITGQTVFEYFGKLVEGKKAQEESNARYQALLKDKNESKGAAREKILKQRNRKKEKKTPLVNLRQTIFKKN